MINRVQADIQRHFEALNERLISNQGSNSLGASTGRARANSNIQEAAPKNEISTSNMNNWEENFKSIL
jgi:predicted ATPase